MNRRENDSAQALTPAHQRDPWELYEIVPEALVCRRGPGRLLEIVLDGQVYSGAVATQAFPRSAPGRYVIFSDTSDNELGLLQDPTTLDPASREVLEAELRLRYVMPIVTKIERVRQNPGSWTFDVITDRGPLRLSVRNLHEHLEGLGSDRLILTDVDGRTAEISSIQALDFHSKRELAKVL